MLAIRTSFVRALRRAGWSIALLAATAIPVAAAQLVVPSVQPGGTGAQSFIRLINAGTANGTYTLTLRDGAGAVVATSTGSVRAGTSQQVPVTATSPANGLLSATAELTFDGSVQHVTYDGRTGALEDRTVCAANSESAPTTLFNVHTTRLPANPSRIVITNTGAIAGSARLAIIDNTTGMAVGSWISGSIAPGGFAVVAEADLEAAAFWQPASAQTHVGIALDVSTFQGSLRHLVDNPGAGGLADLTTRCRVPLTIVDAVAPNETVTVAPIYPMAAAGPVSYLRLSNTSSTDGWYEITLRRADGTAIGTSTGSVAANTTTQVPAAAAGSGAAVATVRTGFDGTLQHVTWDGAVLSPLPVPGTIAGSTVFGVNTSRLAATPSTLVITNTGTAARPARLSLFDSATGAAIGQWSSAAIPAGGSVSIRESSIEQALKWSPSPAQLLVTAVLSGIDGSLQHLVGNTVVTDGTGGAPIRRSGVGTTLSGKIANWNGGTPARVVVASVGGAATLVQAAIAGDGTFSVQGLDPHAQYSIVIDQQGAQFTRANIASTAVTGDLLQFQRQALAGLSDNAFVYHWAGDPTAAGAEYASYVNQPQNVTVTGAATTAVSTATDATVALLTRYGVQLVDDGAPWTREYAARLLAMLDRIPNLATDPYKSLGQNVTAKLSRWTLTDQVLADDVQRLDASYRNGRVLVSSAAFSYAAPLMATLDGRQATFFSNRLFRVAIRFATEEATDLAAVQALMQARYGIKVAIDREFSGLYATLPVAAGDRTPDLWQPFKPREFLTLIAMLEEFPSGLRDLSFPGQPSGLRYMLRRSDGYANPASGPAVAWTASGYVEFMPDAFAQDQATLYELIAHEKAHFLWRSLKSGNLRSEWLALSGWSRTDAAATATCDQWTMARTTWTSNITTTQLDADDKDPFDPGEVLTSTRDGRWASCSTTQFVSAYAAIHNPNEDFAESVGYFLTNPDLVRSRALPKYEFLRDRIMQGTVYLSVIRPDLTFQVLDLNPDYTYPGKINRVDIGVQGAGPEDKTVSVALTVNTADCGNGNSASCLSSVSSGYMRLYSTLGTYIDVNFVPAGSVTSGTLTAQFRVPRTAAAGWWAPRAIVLVDPVGNQRTENIADQEFGWQLYVNNSAPDTTAPKYVAHSLTAKLLGIGDAGASSDLQNNEHEIAVNWRVIEDVSMDGGYCFSRIAYVGAAGSNSPNYIDMYGSYTAFAVSQGDAATGSCEVRVRATRFFPNGAWYPGTIGMEDSALNQVTIAFAANGTTAEAPPQVTVQSANADTVAPVADIGACRTNDPTERCLRVTATPTNPGAPNGETVVEVSYWAYEQQPVANASGLDYSALTLRDPQGKTFLFYHTESTNTVAGRSPNRTRYFVCPGLGAPAGTCDATTPVQYVFHTVLPAGSAPGTWGLTQMVLTDKARNIRTYDFTEVLQFTIAN